MESRAGSSGIRMITSPLTLRLAARLDEHEEGLPSPFDNASIGDYLWRWAEIEAYRDDLRRVGWAVLRIGGDGEAHHIPLQDFYAPPLPPRSSL